MAEAVESALADKRHLIVEAGTGTGKTLAYLVPALLSGKRIVVSTGTKNLQEQLFFKDVPFLQQHFSRPLKVCYMKGRNNYACRQKIYDAERSRSSPASKKSPISRSSANGKRPPSSATARRSRRCPNRAPPGPRSTRAATCAPARSAPIRTLLYHPDAPAGARRATSSSSTTTCSSPTSRCATRKCEGGILPDYHAVVFDEAHEIEDVAGQYFGVSISNYRFQDLRRDLAVLSRMKKFGTPELDRILQRLDELTRQFFRLFGEADRRVAFVGRDAFREDNEEVYTRPAGGARSDRLAPQAAAESARGDHPARSAAPAS